MIPTPSPYSRVNSNIFLNLISYAIHFVLNHFHGPALDSLSSVRVSPILDSSDLDSAPQVWLQQGWAKWNDQFPQPAGTAFPNFKLHSIFKLKLKPSTSLYFPFLIWMKNLQPFFENNYFHSIALFLLLNLKKHKYLLMLPFLKCHRKDTES